MLQSQLFTKTRREAPKDEVSKNASLLIRAGFINKEMAGVYSYLPLGLRVLNKICNIIREEMNAIGGQEVFLSALQNPEVWEKTNRWRDETVDNWFKTELKNGTKLGLGFTHEEPLTLAMKDHINSYRDLPKYVYQIQTKFRNEARAKSGIIRGREFLMKDLYSFSKDQKEHDKFYEKAKNAYTKIFKRLGIDAYITFASGGTFSKYSHEFQVLTGAGEDTIFVDEKKKIAVNKEVMNDAVLKDLNLKKKDLVEKKAVEVGNIFSLGTKFSDAFGLIYSDENGKKVPVTMGSYGIGPGRVMGTIAEIYSDEKGLVWPKEISPFTVHLIEIGESEILRSKVQKIYFDLEKKGIEILYDDRNVRAGEKFADSDLIGIPNRVVVSEKTLDKNEVEVKYRKTGKVEMVKISDLSNLVRKLADFED